jgi:hypothetical protein
MITDLKVFHQGSIAFEVGENPKDHTQLAILICGILTLVEKWTHSTSTLLPYCSSDYRIK